MLKLFTDHKKVIDTGPANATLTIGMCFILLAYFLHPLVKAAYHRVRAYRAWRAIEKRNSVEVTSYPLMTEVFGGRGKCDAARVVTILLAVFSLASWGLELATGLNFIDDGGVDLLQRPPPVLAINTSSRPEAWQIESKSAFLKTDRALVDNMFGSLEIGHAKSRYRMKFRTSTYVNGEVLIASWSDNLKDSPELFYNVKGGSSIINSLECSEDPAPKKRSLYIGENINRLGQYMECDDGPEKQVENHARKDSRSTIIIWKDSEAFMIVEESSSYPSFLYSVWKPEESTKGRNITINHIFHISSSVRLAEAVVTGVVHAWDTGLAPTGGYCFSLLRQFSETKEEYNKTKTRAAPFGERPDGNSSSVKKLSEVEHIQNGIMLNATALMCGVWLVVVTLIGIAWSYSLGSSIGMDIYNRDELIRAVSVQDPSSAEKPLSNMRIFVHKKDTGHIGVVISDSGDERGKWGQFFSTQAGQIGPARSAATMAPSKASCSNSTPVPSVRTFALGAMRMGMERPMPGREGNYCYPTTASPVNSDVSLVGTPLPNLSMLSPTVPNSTLLGGRGMSALFDESVCSTCLVSEHGCYDTEKGVASGDGMTGMLTKPSTNTAVPGDQGAVSAHLRCEQQLHATKSTISGRYGVEGVREGVTPDGATLRTSRKSSITNRGLSKSRPMFFPPKTEHLTPETSTDKKEDKGSSTHGSIDKTREERVKARNNIEKIDYESGVET